MAAKMIETHCAYCGIKMTVREADVKRGWGKFCSKMCKAKEQTRRTGRGKPIFHDDDEYDEHPMSCDGLGQWL